MFACQRIISPVRVLAIYKESSSSVSYVELSARVVGAFA